MRALLFLLVVSGCKEKVDLEGRYEKGLADVWGMTVNVTCPKVDAKPGVKVTCTADWNGKQLTLEETLSEGEKSSVLVTGPEGIYFPVQRLERAIAESKEAAGVQLRCPEKYIIIATGKRGYCEAVRDGKPIGIARVFFEDAAAQKWTWKILDLPGTNIEKLIAEIGHQSKVECPPLALTPGTSVVCKGTLGAETFEAKVEVVPGDIVTEFLDDRRVLPGGITVAKQPVSVKCAKWIPKVDEPVRCTYELAGKQGAVEMSVGKDNKTTIKDAI